jgi:2-polyprenylphenol 6-hydroxylase
MQKTHDVIVVGGNIVGLSLALASAQIGLQVLLLEVKSLEGASLVWDNENPFDARVFAINRASEVLFDSLNVWSEIEARRYFPYTHMEVCDATSAAQLCISAEEVLQPNLGTIVEQQVCFQALLGRVLETPSITLQSGALVQSIQVGVQSATVTVVGGIIFQAPLVVGADGAGSWVRAHLQMPSVREEYGQHALVATIRPSNHPRGMAYQCFDSMGPLALLPMEELVSIVWTVQPEKEKSLTSLSIAAFEKELTLQSQHRLGHLSLISERVAFPLAMQHAKSYVLPRIALVGDAAHTFHPLAGQGLNTGLRDVQMLVRALKKALDRKLDIGSLLVLNRYQRDCKGHNLSVIAAMKAFQWGFATSLQPVKLLRQFGLNHVASQSLIKRWLITEALGLQEGE